MKRLLTRLLTRLIALALTFALATAGPVPARAASNCPRFNQAVSIRVHPFDAPLVYEFDRSEAEMTDLLHHDTSSGSHLHGLTEAKYRSQYQFGWAQARLRNGWCLAPTSIDVHIGFDRMKISVDRKYPSGSCERRAVLVHEAKHVAINYAQMNAGIPRIEAALRQAFQTGGFPIFTTNLEDGQNWVNEYFAWFVKQGFAGIDAGIRRQNAELDNPQEYAGITAMCSHW